MKWSLRRTHGSHPYGGPYVWWRAPWIQSEWGPERRFSLGLLCLFFRSWLHGGWWSDRNLGHTWTVLCQWPEPSALAQKPRGALLKTDLKPHTWLTALSFRRLCGTLVWIAVDLRETVRARDAFSITSFQKKQKQDPGEELALKLPSYTLIIWRTSCWNPYGYHKDTHETTAFVLFNSVGLKGLCVWQKKNMETRQLKRAVFLFWSFCAARRNRKRPPVNLVSNPPRLEFPVLNVLLFQSLCPSPPSLISACSLSFPVLSCFHLWYKEKVWKKEKRTVEWRWERQSAWPHNARAEGRMKELVMSHLCLDPETRSMETHTDLRFCATRMPLKVESDVEKWNGEGERSSGFS